MSCIQSLVCNPFRPCLSSLIFRKNILFSLHQANFTIQLFRAPGHLGFLTFSVTKFLTWLDLFQLALCHLVKSLLTLLTLFRFCVNTLIIFGHPIGIIFQSASKYKTIVKQIFSKNTNLYFVSVFCILYKI